MIISKNIRKEFHDCVDNARNSEQKVSVLTFDLQRDLNAPCISTGEAFYKRFLSVYNLCIYNECDNSAYMYVWDESIASRGSQEIGSCILQHVKKVVSKQTEKIIFWSDSCLGQNRNINVALLMKIILNLCKSPNVANY